MPRGYPTKKVAGTPHPAEIRSARLLRDSGGHGSPEGGRAKMRDRGASPYCET